MKILLTGSHGFIGTHFRNKSDYRKDVVKCVDLKNDEDFMDLKPKDLEGIDTIVHLAAFISGEESWKDPVKYFYNNTNGTFHLIRTAVAAGVKKFIFASSAAIYGNPMTPYGASKLGAEVMLQPFTKDIDIRILRFFNIYGAGQNPSYAGVITKFLDAARNNQNLKIYNNGNSVRDFVYIDDVIEALDMAIDTNNTKEFEKPRDVGTGYGTRIFQLANIIRESFNKRSKIAYMSDKKVEIKISKAHKNRIKMNYTDLTEGLIKTVFEMSK